MTALDLLRQTGERVCVPLRDERLRTDLGSLLAGGADTLVVDVSDVERLSSTCVSTLLGAKRACHARGVRVVLSGPTDRNREVLTRTGLASVFEIESRSTP